MRFILLVSSVGALGACKSACRQRQSLTLYCRDDGFTPRHFGVLRVLEARNDGVLQMYVSCGASNCSAARRVRPMSKPGQYTLGSNVASGCNRMPLQGDGNGLLWLFGCATSLRKSR